MKIHNVEQGTPEWLALRLSIPTASMFGKIITPTGKLSTSASGYMMQLAGEWVAGAPEESFTNADMQRGTEQEAEARNYYQFFADVEVVQVGFITSDDGLIGCSPDGLVGDSGGLEIKCPKMNGHTETLLKQSHPTKYIPQIQGCMMLTDREWWDFVSYHQKIEPLIVRVTRDDEYIKKMQIALDNFNDKLKETKEKLSIYRKLECAA